LVEVISGIGIAVEEKAISYVCRVKKTSSYKKHGSGGITIGGKNLV